jgi:hypothetical protein
MYKLRLRRWGLRKNLTSKDIPDMLQAVPSDSGVGQRTALFIRGRPVDSKKIDRYLKRALGDGNSAAQPPSSGKYSEYFRFQDAFALPAATATKPPTPRPIASPETLQFPEQIIYFSQQFIAGTSRWSRADGRTTGNWLSGIVTAQRLIHEGQFRPAFNILDNCFANLKSILLNIDPALLLRTYGAILSLPDEIGERLLSFVAEVTSIALPAGHPMTLMWQRLRRAGLRQVREHAWHIMASYLTELNRCSEPSDLLLMLTSWTCVYYPLLAGQENCDLVEEYQRKQLQSLEASDKTLIVLHLKLNLAVTCIEHKRYREAKLLIDEVYLKAIQKPETSVPATQDLILHYRYSEFSICQVNGPREIVIGSGKRLHQAFEESFDSWQPWAFVIAGWTKPRFSKLGMEEEAKKLGDMLDLDQQQTPGLTLNQQ